MLLAATACALLLQTKQTSAPLPPPPAAPATVQAARRPDATPISLDGRLTEPAWETPAPATGFRQRDPDEGAPPSERTEVRLLYDDGALYVGARLFDTAPDSIVARLARRDHMVTSDAFTLFLDPYHDGRTGFYFGVNAAGTQYDGTLLNDDWDDNTWDGIWDAAVARDTLGWSVEMRIPYSQLRFHREDVLHWTINLKREIARRNEQDYLVMVPRTESGFVSRFLPLEGMEQIRPPRRLELLPYVTSRAEFLDHAPGDPFNDGSRYRAALGTDLKLGLGSSLTLDLTVNPDFGQVEVDPAVVNLSDMETFYPEKRPFFIEGANIFDFGSGGANNNWGFNFPRPDLFYSRRIGRAPQGSLPANDFADTPQGTTILGALKLTGKLGGATSVGLLSALTGREEARILLGGSRSTAAVEPRTSYNVFRTQREFNGGRQSIGLLATGTFRNLDTPGFASEFNRDALTLGVDGWTFLDAGKMWVITGSGAASRVSGTRERMLALQQSPQHYFQRPDAEYVSLDSSATSLAGWTGRVALNKQRGNWMLHAALGAIHPGFDANDLGFQFRTDVINGHLVGGHRWTTPGHLFRRANLNLARFVSYDFDGNHTSGGYFLNASGQLHNYYSVWSMAEYMPERINTRLTRGGPRTLAPAGVDAGFGMDSDDRKAVVFGASTFLMRFGEGSENSWSVTPYVEWKPAAAVSLRFEPGVEWSRTASQYVSTVNDPLAATTFGQRYVFADLRQTTVSGSLRLNWTFSPRLSLELYAQPLIASAAYRNHKELARPASYDFDIYGRNGSTITPVTDASGQVVEYAVDPDGAGAAVPFTLPNLDFSLASLRGNAVLRWEYLPGSTLFLVWTQDRADAWGDGEFHLGSSFRRLVEARGNHIFAVKLSYWWHP